MVGVVCVCLCCLCVCIDGYMEWKARVRKRGKGVGAFMCVHVLSSSFMAPCDVCMHATENAESGWAMLNGLQFRTRYMSRGNYRLTYAGTLDIAWISSVDFNVVVTTRAIQRHTWSVHML